MTFNNKTIDELHDLLVKKEISVTELTKATLADIQEREGALNSFVTIAEEAALAQSRALDEKGVDADNVMAGIPVAVKDNISTKGILTTAASKMLYNYEPIFNATAVENLYDQDMVIIGKTNMDEFAMGGSGETSYFAATKMLGIRPRCQVVHPAVRLRRWLLVRSVCLWVRIRVVLSASLRPLAVLWDSNRLIARCLVLA